MTDRENVIERIHEAIDRGVYVDLFMDTLATIEEQENESMDKLRIENAELIQRILQLENDLAKERAYNYALVTVIRNNCPPEEGR